MFCCACSGSCNHVGAHSFCEAHGGPRMATAFSTSTTAATYVLAEVESTTERDHKEVMRALASIEAIACWIFGNALGGWVGVFWLVLGFLALWRVLERVGRRAAAFIADRST